MRLDFDAFTLNGPTDTADEATGGLCGRDRFIVTVWFWFRTQGGELAPEKFIK